MYRLIAPVFILSAAVLAQDIAEPKSGEKFTAKNEDMSLLGVGLRTRTIARVKVYAIGLYVADSALGGPLKKKGSPEMYQELVNGDFRKKIVLRFLRDVSTEQVRGAFRDGLKGTGVNPDSWLNYFTNTRSGQECIIAWTPGVGLETKVAGADKPALNDKALASAVFGIWLGAKPIQEDIKKDLAARAGALLK
jgi:hypothetical protein